MDTESEIKSIKERNARVELDKAWETSFIRRAIIAVGTYVLAAVFLLIIKVENPFLAALIPVFGFLLSTLTLPFIRDWWARKARVRH